MQKSRIGPNNVKNQFLYRYFPLKRVPKWISFDYLSTFLTSISIFMGHIQKNKDNYCKTM